MKRSLIITSLALLLAAPLASGWGRLGHATIAKVAEDHLTTKARKALANYLGEDTIVSVAADPDVYRDRWTIDLGYIPDNPQDSRPSWLKDFDFTSPLNIAQVGHMAAVDKNLKAIRSDNVNGHYLQNASYYIDKWAKELKDHAKTMDPVERKRKLTFIIHLVGDFHCPAHITYLDREYPGGGFFPITVRGVKTTYHKWWDGGIFSAETPFGFVDLAQMVDTKSKKEIKEIVKGDVYDWVEACAVDCLDANKVKPGDEFGKTFPSDMRPLLFHQLRNGGYRLAALLNDILK